MQEEINAEEFNNLHGSSDYGVKKKEGEKILKFCAAMNIAEEKHSSKTEQVTYSLKILIHLKLQLVHQTKCEADRRRFKETMSEVIRNAMCLRLQTGC